MPDKKSFDGCLIEPKKEGNDDCEKHDSFIDRYFTHYLCEENQLLFLQHTNALVCVVTLSEQHPALLAARCKPDEHRITKVSFLLSDGTDRRTTKISGKGKKGAEMIKRGNVLCEVFIGDRMVPVPCSISASIIEVRIAFRAYILFVVLSMTSGQRAFV